MTAIFNNIIILLQFMLAVYYFSLFRAFSVAIFFRLFYPLLALIRSFSLPLALFSTGLLAFRSLMP